MPQNTQPEPFQSVAPGSLIRGLRIHECYSVFRAWDFDQSEEENAQRIVESDAIGVSAGYSRESFMLAIRRRFDFTGVDRPLLTLARRGVPFDVFRPALLLHTVRTEQIIEHFFADWLFAQRKAGVAVLTAKHVQPFVEGLHSEGLLPKPWSESTKRRVSSSLLSMAVDMGYLRGKVNREFIPYSLPEAAFLYILHRLVETERGSAGAIDSSKWRMFMMGPEDVERELYRLHQYRQLHFERAGTLTELNLPFASAEACAQELGV